MTAAAACEDGHAGEMKEKEVTVSAGMVQEAKSRPLTKEAIQKQMEKLGDTDFHGRLLRLRQMKHHFAQLVC